MIIFGPGAGEEFAQVQTDHVCTCGERFYRIGSTTMLACLGCGENRWEVPA